MKRAFDVALSAIGIVACLPVVIGLILMIRLDSSGPGIFAQSRVGRNGRVFPCLKLRTMYTGTPIAGTHLVAKAQVTRVGRVLRATKLDELPQLLNVLFGHMSLVGPRPCLPNQGQVMEARNRLRVLRIRPGMTGLAQVAGIDMSRPNRLARVDALYASQSGFCLDLWIILKTVLGR